MNSSASFASLERWGFASHFQSQFLGLLAEAPQLSGCEPARVVTVRRGELSLVLGSGALRSAVLGGRFSHHAQRAPCVGDFVVARPSPGDGPLRVEALLSPASLLQRKAAGPSSEAQPIAANVDVAIVVCALSSDGGERSVERGLNARRIERYLVAIREAHVRPLIAVNKADLRADAGELVQALQDELGDVQILLLSAELGTGVTALEAELSPGSTAVLIGSSGVGKSSLSNRLLGREQQRTQAVREADARGRHTTTARELLVLPSGALLIDTPGTREFGLAALDDSASREAFDDIARLAQACRFRDCQHQGEPGCAVRAAVERGALSGERLDSSLKLEREQRYQRARHDQAAQRKQRQESRQLSRNVRERMRDKYRG